MIYKFLKCIGKGSFGHVYKVKKYSEPYFYSLKRLSIRDIDTNEKQTIMNELIILRCVDHPFLLSYYDCFISINDLYIITPFATYGDLEKVIQKRDGKLFSESKIWHFFIQICSGIHYLHENDIIHRDIKPSNIFIDIKNKIILGDFGISKIFWYVPFKTDTKKNINNSHYNIEKITKTCIGTPLYLSPEIILGKTYSFKIDIWSLGCVLFEMITFSPAFRDKTIDKLKQKIVQLKLSKNILDFPFSNQLLQLVENILIVDVKQRPDIKQIIQYEVIQKKINLKENGYFLNDLKNIKHTLSNYKCFLNKNLHDFVNVLKKNKFNTLDQTPLNTKKINKSPKHIYNYWTKHNLRSSYSIDYCKQKLNNYHKLPSISSKNK